MLKKIILIITFTLFAYQQSLGASASDRPAIKDTIDIKTKYIKSNIRVFSKTISYKYPTAWPMGAVFKKQSKNHFIIEFIGKGQTLKNWQDMLTIQGFKDFAIKGVTSEKMLELLKQSIKNIAPNNIYYKKIFAKNTNDYNKIIALIGVKKTPKNIIAELPKDYGEISLYCIIAGKKDVYIIHRSWKGKPYSDNNLLISKKELQEWTEKLKEISIN